MSENKQIIPISLPGKNIELIVFAESIGNTLIEKLDAIENGEAPFQIQEGCYYEYKITNGYRSSRPKHYSFSRSQIRT